MHHSAISPKRPLLSPATLSENPPLRLPILLTVSLDARWHPRCTSFFSCRGDGDALVARLHRLAPSGFATTGCGDCCLSDEKLRSIAAKDVDVATLGNLCVDIVLNVPALPPPSKEERKAYMEELSASPPDKRYWEAGGNCNTAIAAARLGLNCTAIGHVGNEIYGKFLIDVLHDEGIRMVGMNEDANVDNSSASYETLLCWVLVDPLQRHGFCSRADFRKEPAFSWMNKLSAEVKLAITRSKILFCNGYGFDELCPDLITSALDYSVEVGTSIFFDPGPRGKSLSKGTPEERRALRKFLQMSDVLLLTSDEAESLTGISDPIIAGQELLKQGVRMKWVVIKMGARGSIIITGSSISCAPAFKDLLLNPGKLSGLIGLDSRIIAYLGPAYSVEVNVIDTVGCGDSFVAAIAYGFIHNIPLVNTLALANAVGAATAMGCGAGRNVAKLDQAIELMKASNLNEDDKFWNLVLGEKLDSCEISILSEMIINGKSAQVNWVPLRKVVSELLSELEPARLKSSVTF